MRLTKHSEMRAPSFIGPLLLCTALVQGQFRTVTSEDGLKIEVLLERECTRKSQDGDTIHVHYNGTLEDGTMFDSSYSRNSPFTFGLGQHRVIRGWDEGLLDMCIGEERRLTIPPELAYGDRGVGAIPPSSTLVFGTKLMGIDGVEEEPQQPLPLPLPPVTSSIPLPEPITSTPVSSTEVHSPTSTIPAIPTATPTSPADGQEPGDKAECRLLGPFAIFVQAALGLVAVLSLVVKRYRERPRRPVKVWFFDASKQVCGSALLHVLNLLMSMISSGSYAAAFNGKALGATFQDQIQAQVQDADGRTPNPCSFYLINLAIDTTIGVPVLIVILGVLHRIAALTPLANPPESIKSGNYGQPPRSGWWAKQLLIYFTGLVLMKLFVFFLFQILPWIAWVGDWALRWTEGSEALQIAFVMFVFPVIMNALQYYIIDSFIKDGSASHHEPVPPTDPIAGDEDNDVHGLLHDEDSEDESDNHQKRSNGTKQNQTYAKDEETDDEEEVGLNGKDAARDGRRRDQ